jgi:hypothetical protein
MKKLLILASTLFILVGCQKSGNSNDEYIGTWTKATQYSNKILVISKDGSNNFTVTNMGSKYSLKNDGDHLSINLGMGDTPLTISNGKLLFRGDEYIKSASSSN